MSFTFSPIDARTSGDINRIDVPLGTYMNAEIDEAQSHNMFGNLYRWAEQGAQDRDQQGALLTKEQANSKYGMDGLKFNQDTYEGSAAMMHASHQEELDRQTILQLGSKSLLSARGLGGMAVGMVAGMANPLDFGSMFTPFVGEASSANILGRGMVDRSLFGGSKIAESIFHGVAWQGMAEIPDVMRKLSDNEDIRGGDIFKDLLTQGTMSGGMHLAMHAFSILQPETRNTMANKAVNDFMKGDDVNVGDIAKIDPNVVEQKVMFDHQAEINKAKESKDPYADIQAMMDKSKLMLDTNKERMNQISDFLQKQQDFIEQSGKNPTIQTPIENHPDLAESHEGNKEYDPNSPEEHISSLKEELGDLSDQETAFHSHLQEASKDPLGPKNLLLSMHSDEAWPRATEREIGVGGEISKEESSKGEGKRTIDAIKSGDVTGITRNWGSNVPKPGDRLTMKVGENKVPVRATEVRSVKELIQQYMKRGEDRIHAVRAAMAELSVHSGLNIDGMMKKWREGKEVGMDSHQVIFSKDLEAETRKGLYHSPTPGPYLRTTEPGIGTFDEYKKGDEEWQERKAKLDALEERANELQERNESYKRYQSSRFSGKYAEGDAGVNPDRRELHQEGEHPAAGYDHTLDLMREEWKKQNQELKSLERTMRAEHDIKTGKVDIDAVGSAVNCILKGTTNG